MSERKYLTSKSGRTVGWIDNECGRQCLYGWNGKLYGSGYNGSYYDEGGRYLGNDASFMIMHLLEEYSKVYPNDF